MSNQPLVFPFDLERACIAEMQKNGISFDGRLQPNGQLHRFSRDLKKNQPDEFYIGWEIFCSDGNPALVCFYGTWSGGYQTFIFTSWEHDNQINEQERAYLEKAREARRKEAEIQLEQDRQIRLKKAQNIWLQAKLESTRAGHTEYLKRKRVKTFGIRFGEDIYGNDVLIIPLTDAKGTIQAIQYIKGNGEKHIHGLKKGNFHLLGQVTEQSHIYVVEGYATGASIHEATENPVIVAFDCNNLDSVVAAVRYMYPKNLIAICGDDDVDNTSNSGRARAEEVAKKYQITAVFPSFPPGMQKDPLGNRYTDFNDLAVLMGINEVANQIKDIFLPDWVIEFNKSHAIIHTNQTYILTEKYDPQQKRNSFSLESVHSFHIWYKPKKDLSGKQALSKLWIEHPQRREYRGIVFDPAKKGHYENYYNLFQGFPIKPKEGQCDLFWTLLKEGLCSDNQIKYSYIRKWLAHMIQRPWELPETAIAFRGQQGIGKGSIVQYLARIVARHYLELVQMEQLVGRFNGHLKDAILVYANEAVWGGNKSAAGALKAMITDTHQAVELKGKDIITIQNFKRLILSSNEDWIVPRDIDDRRFVVIDCSTKFKEDYKFFKEFHAQMSNGGLESLMYDLVNEDIIDWHPRKIPLLVDGFDLKVRGMNTPHQWLYYALRDSRIIIDDHNTTWILRKSFEVSKHRIYNDYKLYCEEKKEKSEHDGLFWRRIREVLGEMKETKPHNFSRIITFPSLSDAREMFQKHAKTEGESIWDC